MTEYSEKTAIRGGKTYSEKTTGKELTNKFTHDNNKCKECKQKIIDGLRQIAGGKRKIESLLKSLSA